MTAGYPLSFSDTATELTALFARMQASVAVGEEAEPIRPVCARCALNAGLEGHDIPFAEERVDPESGRVYHLGTCRDCTDFEFSARWLKRYEAASPGEKERLDRQLAAWTASGRRFIGTKPSLPAPSSRSKRPTAKDQKHTAACGCAECETARAFGNNNEEGR